MKRSKKPALPTTGEWIRHLLLSWLFSALLEYLFLPQSLQSMTQLDGLAAMSFPRLLIMTAVFTLILLVLSCRYRIIVWERWAIVGVFLLLTVAVLSNTYTDAFFLFCCLILTVLAVYAIWGHAPTQAAAPVKKSHRIFPVAVGLLAVAFFAVVSCWTVGRVHTLITPNYDFGIFCQMFHNMKHTGLPMTTVERDGLLSHFAVHMSPIYYLMLPFYWLFPRPETLQILQAAVLASSVIPMWLIGKRHGLSGLMRLLLCAVLLLIPTTAGGTSYDLHENCFLLPLVLWLMYAMDRESPWLTGIFALLTLMVKEDAAVYVAVAALYLILRCLLSNQKNPKMLLTGIVTLGVSIGWFLAVTGYLAQQGDGVMTYRYQNFMYDGSGSLLSVIKAVLLCPMKVICECADPEKLPYIAQTLLPLLGLPLLTRKYERYILLIPYILLNLMSDYQYQHSVMFQYNFGSSAFLLYLTAVNLADLRWSIPQVAAGAAAVAVSFSFFCTLIVPPVKEVVASLKANQAYYESITNALSQIPEDASVTAHTFYVVPLSQRSVLYDVRYCSQEHLLSTEYVALRKNSSGDFSRGNLGVTGYENVDALLKANGFTEIHSQGSLIIYHNPDNR